VVAGHDLALQVVADAVTELDDLGPLLEQRQHGDLVRGEIGMEPEHDARLTADLLLPIAVDEERESRPIGPAGRLDDPWNEVLLGLGIEVLEVLAGCPGVTAEVEIA